MIYLIAGVGVLAALFLVARAFVAADPARLSRFITWFLGALAVLGAGTALVLLLLSERLLPALVAAGTLSPVAIRLWRQWRTQAAPGASTSRSSHVESEMIAMTLDHATGEMSGVVKRGTHAGRRLEHLGEAELLDLWQQCRASDADGTRLVEAYLDRAVPDWWGKASAGARRSSTGDPMTREEAYAILGLAPGAGEAQIRDAHRRLMKKVHPDQGGSNYLAAKLNRAKDVLLGE
ncbi:MAG: DnaJ domain-containing protein [Alphaproteobacteria bacterium]|nr:DnaJ domain-containing protein [Alphaproteobacteria bacterium]